MSLPQKCPLCMAGTKHQSVVTSHVYGNSTMQARAFFHCESCDVRYQYPGLSREEERRFYASEFEGFMTSRSGKVGGWSKAEEHINANESTRLRRMAYIEPFLEQNRNILEVGCSSGFMLYPLVVAGFSCTGIEPSGVFSDYVKSREVNIYESIEQLQLHEPTYKFDLILHFFVLEHIADPLAFLSMQLDLLSSNGKIIFEIPNVADPLYSIYDIPEFEKFYWSLAHPWYFSEASLHYLLGKLGKPYKIFRDQRYDLSNHMVWAKEGRPGGLGRFTEFLGSELETYYKKTLIEKGYCDTLIGVIVNE
jgi:SAM-dependent methyltransferase